MVCEICNDVLGFDALDHTGRPCPVAKSLYCGACSVYGHSPARCTAGPSRWGRGPDPDTEPFEFVHVDAVPEEFVVEDSNAAIAAALLVNGETPMICQEKGRKENRDYKENRKRLAAFVKKAGRALILISNDPPK